MLKSWLSKLVTDINKSWAYFKVGLGIFAIGVVLILVGRQSLYWIQIPGLLCIAIGSVFAAKGYVGIFAHRMKNAFKQAKVPSDADK
jgi:hypothetical protein